MIDNRSMIKVFALGNALLGDAGIGLAIGHELYKLFPDFPVEINIAEETMLYDNKSIKESDFVMIIIGLPSTHKVGSITQFTLNNDIRNTFQKNYNFDEIPDFLQKIISNRVGEILVININKIDWTTDYSSELQKQLNNIIKQISLRIKIYIRAYL